MTTDYVYLANGRAHWRSKEKRLTVAGLFWIGYLVFITGSLLAIHAAGIVLAAGG